MPLRYFADTQRHLVCLPYTVNNLHQMARDLGIVRSWYHPGTHPHYDIPKRRIEEILARCIVIDPRDILKICKGEYDDS